MKTKDTALKVFTAVYGDTVRHGPTLYGIQDRNGVEFMDHVNIDIAPNSEIPPRGALVMIKGFKPSQKNKQTVVLVTVARKGLIKAIIKGTFHEKIFNRIYRECHTR